MARFNPTSVTIQSTAPAPDPLAGAVINALSRPLGLKTHWGVIRTLVLGIASFGALPLLAWVRGFYKYAAGEQQQYLHLARWVKQNSAHQLATRLEADANELRPRGFLAFLTVTALLFTIAGVGYVIDQSGRMPEHLLLAGTYGYERHRILEYKVWQNLAEARTIFAIWFGGLAVAYGLHWLQVTLHAADVKQFVKRFSKVAEAEGIARVKADPLGTTIRPLWMAGAAALVAAHAPWGILMMLAGAAQRRYVTWSGRNTRADVAHRLRAMVERRRPGMAVPAPVFLRDRCVEAKCRAELPRGAAFCRRCGTRQRVAVDRVA